MLRLNCIGPARSLKLRSCVRAFSIQNMSTKNDFKIDSYHLDYENRQLHVDYHESGIARKARYPYIWLQDNCQSPESFNNVLHFRKSHLSALKPDMKPEYVKTIDSNALEIKWENGHDSWFTIKFLHERRFPGDVTKPDESIFSEQLKELGNIRCWDSDMKITYYHFEKLMENDQTLMSWMQNLWCEGLTIIEDAPPVEKRYDGEDHPLKLLCKRVSFARKVNFGDFWDVFNKPDSQNIAYTNGPLSPHTDIPAYKNSPEIQLLHCIKQASEGGSNYMVDGFKVAEYVKKEYPRVFDILVNTPIHFREWGHDPAVGFYDLESQHNTLQIDPVTRKIEKVIWSQHQRASVMDVPLERVEEVYSALMQWDSLLFDKRFMIKLRLKNNDIMCFNNLRVLHGREEFIVEGDDERWLKGCYLEWDEIRSRFRALRNVYGQDWNDVL